jgi:hypothetical protein
MKGKGQGHSWPSVIVFSSIPAFECNRSYFQPLMITSFFFFCKLSNRFLCIESHGLPIFSRGRLIMRFFVVREWCVYSYAAPSPHSWPSAQVECIKFKHSLMKKIAHGVSRLYMLGRHMRLFSLFSCLLCIRTREKQTNHLSQQSGTQNCFLWFVQDFHVPC